MELSTVCFIGLYCKNIEKALGRYQVKHLVIHYLTIEHPNKFELCVRFVNLNKLTTCVRNVKQHEISSELSTQKYRGLTSNISGVKFDTMRFEVTFPNDGKLLSTWVNHRQELAKSHVFQCSFMIKSHISDIWNSLFWAYELLRVIYHHIAILTECYSNLLIKRGRTVPIMKRQFV